VPCDLTAGRSQTLFVGCHPDPSAATGDNADGYVDDDCDCEDRESEPISIGRFGISAELFDALLRSGVYAIVELLLLDPAYHIRPAEAAIVTADTRRTLRVRVMA
jgi:hypothetical protein